MRRGFPRLGLNFRHVRKVGRLQVLNQRGMQTGDVIEFGKGHGRRTHPGSDDDDDDDVVVLNMVVY